MGVLTYRPADVTLVFAGVPITGFAEGTMITVAKASDGFNLNMGSTGTGARAQSHDESGTITFRLQQTAEVNAALTALHEADKASGNGVFPVGMKDLSGADTVAAQTAWITKIPDMEYSNEINAREWVIASDNLVMAPGGNP